MNRENGKKDYELKEGWKPTTPLAGLRSSV